MYQDKTGKGIIFYDSSGQPTRPLDEANMFIALRFANLHEPDKTFHKYRFEGRAVLLIMNSEKSSINNFLNFMSNEKVRLLLLIREDLLKYLDKQFNNDAFGEVLENKKHTLFKRGLRHGLSSYLNILETLNYRISKENDGNLDFDFNLFKIIINAIRGQISEFKADEEKEKIYSQGDIFKIIICIFISEFIPNNSIEFKHINTQNFPDVKISANELIMDVVFPEILINMKKYGLRKGESEFLISYCEKNRTQSDIRGGISSFTARFKIFIQSVGLRADGKKISRAPEQHGKQSENGGMLSIHIFSCLVIFGKSD